MKYLNDAHSLLILSMIILVQGRYWVIWNWDCEFS